MSLEYELKYLEPDFVALRKHLAIAAAEQTARPYFEENLVFDYPDRSLKSEGILLRLRRKARGEAVLTVKRPSDKDASSKLKVLEEVETGVADFDATRIMLEMLGYVIAFGYEKVREKWRFGEVVVCMDRLPFGNFVELEGPEDAVLKGADVLGLGSCTTTTATYHELNGRYRERAGGDVDENFVFTPEQKEEIVSQLTL